MVLGKDNQYIKAEHVITTKLMQDQIKNTHEHGLGNL